MPMISAKTLMAKLRETRTEFSQVNDKLAVLHERYDTLQTRMATLMELLRELEPDNPEVSQQMPASLTDAVLEYVRARPGIRAADVVNSLATIPTTAKDPRKNIHQTILNLRNRGRIEKREDGGLAVPSSNGTAPKS